MNKIKVLLVGGPAMLGEDDRLRYVTELGEKIKLPIGNGYEHFQANGESCIVDGSELPVFAWCGGTKVAE